MPTRKLPAAILAALAVTAASGCAVVPPRTVTPNPIVIPAADRELVWNKTVAVLDEYFDGITENRLAGRIETEPIIGATLLEPWHGDSVGFNERLESSLQTIRRFAIATVTPAPGGGWAVKVMVMKQLEDLPKPDRQAGGGRAVFANDFPINRTRDIVGPVPLPVGWIDRGRDAKLEQVILARLRRDLIL